MAAWRLRQPISWLLAMILLPDLRTRPWVSRTWKTGSVGVKHRQQPLSDGERYRWTLYIPLPSGGAAVQVSVGGHDPVQRSVLSASLG